MTGYELPGSSHCSGKRHHPPWEIYHPGCPGTGRLWRDVQALFRPIPNLELLSPVSAQDLKVCFEYALEKNCPVVIRYPKMECPAELADFSQKVKPGKGILLSSQGKALRNKYLIVSTGSMYSEVNAACQLEEAKKIKTDIYLMRFIKPFNEEYFISLAKEYKGVLFVEDGVKIGGISEYLAGLLARNKYYKTRVLAFDDKFYNHGTRNQILQDAGLSARAIAAALKELSNV